ncbi:helix-turn-helix domain-containing protein [Spartinivicinus ruber]|uniref:helix-turn-helix domain-containing protein n=1 Tax=Spartinivicinus ruber TaxID=2683272 RepID=UPI0013D03271|nr:XRE family transcriptional regulator [Spartinivicinus ruber]
MTTNDLFGKIFIGDKLKLARLATGMSLEEAGSVIDVSRQYVHKLETGSSYPSDSQIEQFANLYMVAPSFFFQHRTFPIEPSMCHFRSVRSSTQALKNMIMARAEVFDSLVNKIEEEVELPADIIPDFGLDYSKVENIEKAAELFRREFDLGIGPISDTVKLAENLGIVVANISGADDRVDAFSIHNKRPMIIRNTAKESPCRLRFDIAHEIGHLVMHNGVETGCKRTEDQANQFASALLMPRTSFPAEFPRMRGSRLNWDALGDCKVRWKVSLKAIIYRAKTLGIITNDQARTGFTTLARHGQTKTEKFDELVPQEYPSLIQRAIDLLDFRTWKDVVSNAGLTSKILTERYGLRPIQSPMQLASIDGQNIVATA